MTGIINSALFVLIVVSLLVFAKRNWSRRRFLWEVWREFRPLMAIEAASLAAVTFTIFIFLQDIGEPFTWGWYSLLSDHASNASVAPIVVSARSNILTLKLAGFGIYVLLILLIPLLVECEEGYFRKGRETWRSIVPAAFNFGMMHLLVGVPFSIALALVPLGLSLGWHYKRTVALTMASRPGIPIGIAREIGVRAATIRHALYDTLDLLWTLVAMVWPS